MARLLTCAACALALVSIAASQDAPTRIVDELTQPFDRILDRYVRDGYVYYAALKQERSGLDRYLSAMASVPADELKAWPRQRQLAFWINAYNAFVLEAVIDNYPIRGDSASYPPNSIRQVVGAFEVRTFRAGGRSLTLDAIEREVIDPFGDARTLLALARGSIGGGRLRSEAYVADRIEVQLAEMAEEIVTRREMVLIDPANNQVSVSPLFSWREQEFIASFTDRADTRYIDRSPIERAVLALLAPIVLPLESDFLLKNQFHLVFHDYDWRLNDLAER
ncbi:MAG: DUF547 domain-containing protein [Vicinamibacterales bacterium]